MVISGGMIFDCGLFGVFVVGEFIGVCVGEFDEEMVYELWVGDVFMFGIMSWWIVEIMYDCVNVIFVFG